MTGQETQTEDARKVEGVVLYHGSLAELNLRNPNKQYEFAEELSMTYVFDERAYRDEVDDHLRERGFDGLVNRGTSHSDPGSKGTILLEGTPIVRVRETGETQ